MPIFETHGVRVDFPKHPYDCQVQYISKVIEALNARTNALLESPTGTGKTLCLLCATLAWQTHQLKKYENESAPMKLDYGLLKSAVPSNTNAASTVGVIIYATRTHSQLAQVVDELRDTAYRPRMSVLGSREQLCIHDKISKLKGAIINHACNSLNSRRGCTFKNNLESFINTASSNDVMDIEDLVEVGKAKRICPYFYSRDTSVNSEIIFMPYNYLLDNSIRKTLKISWENAIIIFDEAHNLERVSSDAASFALSSTDIASCIQELQQVLNVLKEEHGNLQQSSDIQTALGDSSAERPTLASVVGLLKSMFNLEKYLDSVPLQPHQSIQNAPCAILSGVWLVKAFVQCGLRDEMQSDDLRKCANMLMEESESSLNGANDVLGGSATLHASEPKLNIFAQAFDRIMRSARSNIEDYKVYISEESTSNKGSSKYTNTLDNTNKQKKRVINFWCFCSGVALQELASLGVRSILLTSGTLSPMEAMKDDLRLPFPIELQNPHVIGNNQMWLAALQKGSKDVKLNSSFQNRDSTEYKDELGQTILSIYQQLKRADEQISVSQPGINSLGGILVFFPAYAAMDNIVERWKFTKLYDVLLSTIGHIIIEPKSSAANAKKALAVANTSSGKEETKSKDNFMFQSVPNKKAAKVKGGDEEDSFNSIISEFDSTIQRLGSCLLLAVCRGKVSEGIDFSDNKGRVVIITGIPFAPYQDPWVVLKKEYLDEKCRLATQRKQTQSSNNSNSNNPLLNGNTMSMQQYQLEMSMQNTTPQSSAYSNPWLKAKEVHTHNQTLQQQQYVASCNVLTNKIQQQQQQGGAYGMNNINMQPTITAVSGTAAGLNGQMWYNQSASRAVNQCLGRVIRHKNDWGAVFLLDERFLYDHQVSQLSTWMRPLVHKYSTFQQAIKEFSIFVHGIARNPAVRYTIKAAPALQDAPITARQPNRSRTLQYESSERSKDPIQRIVELDDWQLGADEQQTYINQDLLLTQPASNASNTNQIREDELAMIAMSADDLSHSMAQNISSNSNAKDLRSIIDRLKNKPAATASAATEGTLFSRSNTVSSMKSTDNDSASTVITTGSYLTSQANNQSAKSVGSFGLKKTTSLGASGSGGKVFGLGNTTTNSSFPSKPIVTINLADNDEDSNPFSQPWLESQTSNAGVYGKVKDEGDSHSISMPSFSQASIKPLPAVPRQKATLSLMMNQQGSSSNTQQRPADSKSDAPLSQNEILKSALETLKSAQLPSAKLQEFKKLLQSIKQNGGIQTVVQIKTFQSSLLAILTDMPFAVIRRILLSLATIVIPNPTSPNNPPSSSQKSSPASQLLQHYESQATQALNTLTLFQSTQDLPSRTNNNTTASNIMESSQQTSIGTTQPVSSTEQGGYSSNLSKRLKNVVGEEDIGNIGSKRAKLLLNNIQRSQPQPSAYSSSSAAFTVPADSAADNALSQSVANSKNTIISGAKPFVPSEDDLMSKLHKISKLQFTRTVPAHHLSHPNSSVMIQQLACIVCKEVATQPCASKCGHICCQNCWLSWLKIQKVCPLCRQPVDVNTITRIVKKAHV